MAEPAIKKRRLSPPRRNGSSLPGFANWDLENEYQQRMQKRKKNEKRDKLLIKTADGKVIENPRMNNEQDSNLEAKAKNEEDDDVRQASAEEDADSGIADLESRSVPRKPSLPLKEQIRQAKEELARIASSVSENPEEHIAQLGSLAQLMESENLTVKKLVLATQLEVFKDVIPGYRIRPLSRDEAQGKLSKDVKKLRNFEQGLLSGYKHYTQTLGRLANDSPSSTTDNSTAAGLASVAISCACTLLTSVPHFNFRPELIGIMVRKLSQRHPDADFVKCRESIEQLFREDEDGNASLDVVGQLTKMMKSKNYSIHESVLNTFLHLRLLSEFSHKASTNSIDKDDPEDEKTVKNPKQKREFRTKRERKMLRERKGVEKEMRQADAVVSYEERDKNQAETLKLVFVAYFRILKDKVPHLMGAVLEGLAKYSHLINQDFFGDVLEALKDLIGQAEAALQADEDESPEIEMDDQALRNLTRESLLCVITAFALLQGQQDVAKSANNLHLDLRFFITHLYRTLLPFSMDPNIESGAKLTHFTNADGVDMPTTFKPETKINVATTVVLLLRSLESVLLPPTHTKAVPSVRVAAFIKQLESASLHLPQKSTTAVLELVRQVTKIHGSRVSALWYTEERKGDGVFDPQSQEIESSNPFASTVWEGELLRSHFDPKVRDLVIAIEKNVDRSRA